MINNQHIDIRDAFFDAIFELAQKDKDLIFLCADMGAFSLNRFKKELGTQFINMGVAEANMISVAAGLALSGKNVFVYSIIPFVTMRVFEQIKIDFCCMNLPVTIVGMGAGLTYSSDGPTHHAIHDVALMRSLPEMTIYHPADASSAAAIAQCCYDSASPCYVRLEKGTLPNIYDPNKIDCGQGVGLLRQGADATIITYGIMTAIALDISTQLDLEGLKVAVIDCFRLKPLNFEAFSEVFVNTKCLLTIEEHALTGGCGSAMAELLSDLSCQIPLKRCAIADCHVFDSASREELQALFGLTSDQLKQSIKDFIALHK